MTGRERGTIAERVPDRPLDRMTIDGIEVLSYVKDLAPSSTFKGKRAAMVVFSRYPADERVRRAAHALTAEGLSVDLICLAEEGAPKHEAICGIEVRRLPIVHRRGNKLSYAYNYCAFILMSSIILAVRSLKRRYDLVYIHNMPDVLVVSALIPKALGAKVVLDLHDPMPELMSTIFGVDKESLGVRLIKRLEKWSIARSDLVITVNLTCRRLFAARSCSPEKIGVVMNSPDHQIFPLRTPQLRPTPDGGPAKRFVIMYHGSLVHRNGLDLAVLALAQVRLRVPTAELRIYGQRNLFLEQVMAEAHTKGLKDCVHYLGPKTLPELVREIDDCDVGLIPNHRNAFTEINTPTRIFEYLVLGKPVIAPRTPGIEDYFGADSLLFFESGDAASLARQIEYVYLHPSTAVKTVERGQKVLLAHTWPRERRVLLDLVSGLLNGG